MGLGWRRTGSGLLRHGADDVLASNADLVAALEAAAPGTVATRVSDRLAFAHGHELEPFCATAVAVTPGWLRSEMMLDNYGITEANWHTALEPDRGAGLPAAPPGFAESESPRYVGRAVAAIAADMDRARWNQQSVTSAELAREYGFTDIDGRQRFAIAQPTREADRWRRQAWHPAWSPTTR